MLGAQFCRATSLAIATRGRGHPLGLAQWIARKQGAVGHRCRARNTHATGRGSRYRVEYPYSSVFGSSMDYTTPAGWARFHLSM
jgi:hypothetical protein